MSESQQDPSANTARFRAFVEQAPPETSPSRVNAKLIGGIVVAIVIVVIILAVAL
jgi:hypothetical protein